MNTTEEGDTAKLIAWDAKASNICYYLSLSIAIVGLAGNTLCAKVLGKVQRIVKGVRLIRYLTIVDILVLVLSHLIVIPWNMTLLPSRQKLRRVLSCAGFIFIPIFCTIYMFETYLTVLIGVQRCLALTMPFKFKRIMRDSVINKILTCILLFSVFFNIPNWISFMPSFYWNYDLNMTLIWSDDENEIISEDVAYHWIIVQLIFNNCIPLVILMVCNISLIISRQRMVRIHSSRDRMRANQMTAIVMTVTVMSIVVHVLNIAVYVASEVKLTVKYSSYTYLTTFLAILYTKDVVVCVNSSTNFIFYATFGREFRRTLTAMFRRRPSTHQRQRNVIELNEMPNLATAV